MTTHNRGVPIPGTHREPPPGARAVGPANPHEPVEVSVLIRPQAALRSLADVDQLGAQLPGERQHISRAALEQQYAASAEDINKVEEFAHEHGLTVTQVDPVRRIVGLAGTAAQMSTAFGVNLVNYQLPDGTQYRGRTDAPHVPPELADIVQLVAGLDVRPQAQAHFQRASDVLAPPAAHPQNAGAPAGFLQSHSQPASELVGDARDLAPRVVLASYPPNKVAQLYDFPSNATGHGQCVGIIELGGGYRIADLKTYFHNLGIKAPKVTAVSIDGGRNQPGGDADGEVMLDIEVVGAVAPGAQIVVYFAPNTNRGFLDAVTTAIHDRRHKPSVISISWGAPEGPPNWTAQAMQAYNQIFQEAAALGVTICAAAGDNGSGDGAGDSLAHVDFPASSPYVLGCGGTKLLTANGAISSEVVWDERADSATGGGVSTVFALPTWQQTAHVPPSANPPHPTGRGVPDVAGDADPLTGYAVRVDGQDTIIGGTSAVAPLWAALIALLNEKLNQPVGYLNPLLYTSRLTGAGVFHDINSGNNGAYSAGQGWDACTGWGSPDGSKLLATLSGH